MFVCPYTGSTNLVPVEMERKRPETYQIVQCSISGFYSAKHVSGKIYPLEDKNDPNSDILLKVKN